jgi:hypothetical protein
MTTPSQRAEAVPARKLRGESCGRRDRVQLRLRRRSDRFTQLRRQRCPMQHEVRASRRGPRKRDGDRRRASGCFREHWWQVRSSREGERQRSSDGDRPSRRRLWITYTTASALGASLSDVTVTAGSSVSATLPAAGVVTFFARAAGVDGGHRMVRVVCRARRATLPRIVEPRRGAQAARLAPRQPMEDRREARGTEARAGGASGAGGVAATSGRSTGGAAPNAASGSDDDGGCGCRSASRAGTSDVLPQLLCFLLGLYLAGRRKRASDSHRAG